MVGNKVKSTETKALLSAKDIWIENVQKLGEREKKTKMQRTLII